MVHTVVTNVKAENWLKEQTLRESRAQLITKLSSYIRQISQSQINNKIIVNNPKTSHTSPIIPSSNANRAQGGKVQLKVCSNICVSRDLQQRQDG